MTDPDELERLRAELDERLKQTNAEIGRRVQAARKAADWTQEKAAERFYLIKQTVSHWETGNNAMTAAMLLELARLYSQSPEYLLTGSTPTGLSLDAERLVRIFSALSDAGKQLITEAAEDRLDRERRESRAGRRASRQGNL